MKIRDGNLKDLLLRLIEWHARLVNGQADTWHMGRFLDQWGDPRARQQVEEIFAHYDADDSRRALRKSIELFRWLAHETAEKAGFDYPIQVEERALAMIET